MQSIIFLMLDVALLPRGRSTTLTCDASTVLCMIFDWPVWLDEQERRCPAALLVR